MQSRIRRARLIAALVTAAIFTPVLIIAGRADGAPTCFVRTSTVISEHRVANVSASGSCPGAIRVNYRITIMRGSPNNMIARTTSYSRRSGFTDEASGACRTRRPAFISGVTEATFIFPKGGSQKVTVYSPTATEMRC